MDANSFNRRLRLIGGRSLAWLVTSFLASILCAAEPTEKPALTLEQAVAAALEHNRLVQSSALDVGRAEDRLAEAKSQRWPTLSLMVLESRLLTSIDFQFEKGIFGTYPGIGPIPAQDTKVGTPRGFTTLGLGKLQLPISQQYKIGLNVHLSELSALSSREELRSRRQTTVARVRKAYYGVLEAQTALAFAEDSLSLAREVERVIGEKLRAEKALEVDSIEARARLARAESDHLAARNAVAQRKEELNSLLGRDIGAEFRATEAPEAASYPRDLAAARARALELAPALRQARLQVSQADLSWKLSRAQFIPDLAFQAAYISPYSVDFLPRNIYSVGFLFQWEVFDAGRRRHDVAEKNKAREQARLAQVDRESSTLLDVGEQFRRVEESRKSLSASELNRSARRDRLRIARDRYEQQAIIAEDLLRAQADLAEADRQYVRDLAGFWSARADLERAVGEDM